MPGVSQEWSPLDPTVVCARVSMRTTPTVYPFRLRILSCQILFPAGAISQAKMEATCATIIDLGKNGVFSAAVNGGAEDSVMGSGLP